MSSRQMRRITLFGLLFIAAAIGLLFVMRSAQVESLTGALPAVQTGGDAETPVNPEGLSNEISMLQVSRENVQQVIATLARPEEYSRAVMVESFWEDGNAVYRFDVAVRDGVTAVRTFSAGTTENIIITSDYTYIWYAGDAREAALPNRDGDAGADKSQMMLTYEDILELDAGTIIDAGLTNDESGPGVFVRYRTEMFGYITECRVSIATGLMTGAEQYDGEELIYRMSSGSFSEEIPGESLFLLPSGQNALTQ